ncbi:MAG: hypothetical protein ACK52I_16555, partial [Pseudomonadota bacterium]
ISSATIRASRRRRMRDSWPGRVPVSQRTVRAQRNEADGERQRVGEAAGGADVQWGVSVRGAASRTCGTTGTRRAVARAHLIGSTGDRELRAYGRSAAPPWDRAGPRQDARGPRSPSCRLSAW